MTQATTRPQHEVAAEAPLQIRDDRSTGAEPEPATDLVILEDLLVEDVSIDGMCGVY